MGTSGLGALLVKEGLLTQQDRMIIGKSTGHAAWAFAKGVLASGLLDETELASLLAERTPFAVAPRNFTDTAEHDALVAMDVNLMQELEVYPLKLSGHTLTVAVCDPLDKTMWNQLSFFTGFKIKPVIAPLSDIRAGLKRLNPNFEANPSAFESFIHNHAPAAYRHQARQERPAARVSEAAALLPEEPVIQKVTFPKLEDLPPITATPSAEAALNDLDSSETSDLVLDDLPPLEGDDAADLSFEGAEPDADAMDDFPLEEALDAAETMEASPSDENISLEEAEAALDASDLDFDLGGDGASLDLDLEIPQMAAPSEETASGDAPDDAVPVDELVAEGDDLLAETLDVAGLEEEALALEEPQDPGLDDTALAEERAAPESELLADLAAPEDDLVADLSLGEESLLGDIPIENDLGDDLMEQVVFHPAMSDLNQALLYLSFATSLEDAYQNAVTGWSDVTPCGVIYELEGKDALPRFVWENGVVRTSGLDAWRVPAARDLALKMAAGTWQDVPAAAPFASWSKIGKLVGCRVGEDKMMVMIAATKAQAWQIEGFQQAVLSLFQGLAQKRALPSLGRERRVAD